MMIDYQVIRRPRRKTLAIKVTEENDVLVYAPQWISQNMITSFVTTKSRWIDRVIKRNLDNFIPPKQCISGELFLFMGDLFPLSFEDMPKKEIVLTSSSIRVQGPLVFCDTPGAVKDMLCSWYKHKALDIMQDRVDLYATEMSVYPQKVRVKTMKTRWGSCSSKGSLNFNWRLIMAPLPVLDYVVVHELCHLRYMNHAPLFWDYVRSVMPEYEQHKQWLHENGYHLVL